MLLKAQRNEIFQLLQSMELDPTTFTENNSVSPPLYELQSRVDERLFFRISRGQTRSWGVTAYPSYSRMATFQIEKTLWREVLDELATWLKVIKVELEAPDLWADLQANARLLGPIQAAPEEVFTPDEARQLRIQLQHVQQQLLTAGLPEAAARQLVQAVQEAGTKAERFTKKEWQSMFIGSIISTMTGLALNADSVKMVYQILKTTFTGLFLP